MDLSCECSGRIQRPQTEVFDAVYNPKKLAGYFVTAGASGPMDAGQTVMWDFADFPGAFPVIIKESVKSEKLVFEWGAASPRKDGTPYNTTVTMTFQEITPANTLVSISETGWEESDLGAKSAKQNAVGWMNMLMCMKAYVEHGINLREGMFK